MRQKEVLLIIPAYNEEKNIEKVMKQLAQPEIADIVDVLVMNDASSDNTNWLAKEYGCAVVTHVFNLGYGSGLQLGYKYAIRRGYSYVIQMDADGQHDVCNIPKIYQRLKEKDDDGRTPDIVLGSRFMKGSTEFEVSFAKKMAFVLFRKMLYLATGRKIADPTTGLQGLSRKAVLYYSKYNHFDDKYPDTNMITQMLLLDFKVVEIPAVMHARTSGKSMHSGLKPIWYMMRMFYSVLAVIFRCKVLKMDAGAGRIDVEREDKKYPELARREEKLKAGQKRKNFQNCGENRIKKSFSRKRYFRKAGKRYRIPGVAGIIYILSTRRKPGNRSTSPVKRKNLSFSELISEHSGTSRFQNRLWNGFEGFWHFFGRKEKE